MQDERLIFGPLGLSAADQQIYEHMLDHPGLTVTEIARSIDLPVARVRESVTALLHAGLGSRSAGKPARYYPARPDTAIDALIRRRQDELEQARAAAAHLTERFHSVNGVEDASMDFVELIEGRDAYAQRFLQISRAAKKEMLGFDKPPYVTMPQECADVEFDQLRRGVSVRVICEHASIEQTGLELFRDFISAGEKARVVSEVPLKLTIIDRRLGLIPLSLDEGQEQGVLLYPSPLLDALIELFETLWAHAVPIVVRRETVSLGDQAVGGIEDDDLLVLLQAGFKDEAIARRLGVSRSTVERRMRHFMQELGASTRFQAGFAAAARLGLSGKGSTGTGGSPTD